MKLIIISGRSGSGKSIVLRSLEDLGYYCVDNIPVNLLPTLTHTVVDEYDQVAVSIDVRNLPKDPEELVEILDYLPATWELMILYLDASDDVLIKRFSETRRLHPLSKRSKSLTDAIQSEAVLLAPIAERADLYIDTGELSVHQLAELVRERILGKKSSRLVLVFESFGFKHGIPKDADYVFDARFLPNPHWEPELKHLTGLDPQVETFLGSQAIVTKFIWQIQNLISTWLPHLERNNRSYVTIAIGCTGGQHRSVYVAESLARTFRAVHPDVQIRHRELSRE
ncbi:RNase adapter RapZ [Lacimicrobium alkaliphilum]|uniref:GlmZ(SRNA)-inactivating NTPase n=1 Tax=Lacimicrobium alkaliphilum TaxID=1526571 RepID=A0A0U3AWP8_9ALTE|nr:RNase adapter RapZ [Lacimicrobium alkaliphilum]ALS97384.1 glmZ(sRNA)-inactivating NTPase [Lacimicrobium alkaliphilum]